MASKTVLSAHFPVQIEPDTAALEHLAALHAESGDNETAIRILRAAIGIAGPEPHLCRNLGIVFERAGNRPAAIGCYRQVIETKPDDVAVWRVLAGLLTAENRPADAAGAWDRVCAAAPRDRAARQNWADALALAGLRPAAIARYDEILAADPENVIATFHRAVALMQENQQVAAIDGFRRTLALAPGHARAANNLGILLQLGGEYPEAIESYRSALRADRAYTSAMYNLGTAWHESGRSREAIAVFRKVLKTQPDHAEAWTNLGNAWLTRNAVSTARGCYQRALALRPGAADAAWNLGIADLLEGDLANGWRGFERRFEVNRATPRRELPMPLWRGEPLAGKSIYLYAEQGLGDTLQFVRYAPVFAAQGARVIVDCQQPLERLLAGMEGIAALGPAPEADYQLPLPSAPAAAGATLDSIPLKTGYLRAPEEDAGRWRARLGPGVGRRRIGLAWAGNPNHRNDRNRSIPSDLVGLLTSFEGVEWILLQKGYEPAPGFTDFADTAGLIENLDLVISVDTSVAHLAGALGKPVWVLLPFAPDWRWMLEREDSPWYAGARLFRQREAGDWGSVLREVREAIMGA